jgi:1-acyl-sn-glycerol-3-phosphate acyltransferase
MRFSKRSPRSDSREPGEVRRDLLRTLYSPYTYGVFIPYLSASTVFWGAAAVASSKLSRNLSFHCGTIWAWLLCRATFVRVKVEGREHLVEGQSYVIMSNHQSHFDVLAFYGHFFKQFRWVMKEELRKVPGLGAGCESVGHIFIDRSSREKAIASLKAARHLLEGGVSIMFFPEGTRSTDGRMKELKKGGFMMALDLNLPILPVSISGSRHVLPSNTHRLLPGEIRIRIHEPIDVSAYGPERRDELMQDVARAIRSGLTPWERGERL